MEWGTLNYPLLLVVLILSWVADQLNFFLARDVAAVKLMLTFILLTKKVRVVKARLNIASKYVKQCFLL